MSHGRFLRAPIIQSEGWESDPAKSERPRDNHNAANGHLMACYALDAIEVTKEDLLAASDARHSCCKRVPRGIRYPHSPIELSSCIDPLSKSISGGYCFC